MGDLQVVGGIKKLNNQNYNTWVTCIESYLQGQDLWEVVGGSEVTQPAAEDANGVLRKWKIKAGKSMFALKTTIEEEMLEHIRDNVWKNSKFLQSEVVNRLQEVSVKKLSSSVEQEDAELDLLLHFLKADVEEVERRHSLRKPLIDCGLYDESLSGRKYMFVSKDSRSEVLSSPLFPVPSSNESRLMKNIDQFESAYFSMRSRIQIPETDSRIRRDKDLLRTRNNWYVGTKDEDKETCTDRLGAIFDGLCKYSRYSNTGQEFAQYTEHATRACGSDDGSVKLWSINEKNCLDTIKHAANVCCVQFSAHSSHLLAFGSADYRTYCYDLRNTKIPWCVLDGHKKAVSYVKFLDSETLLWDLNRTSMSDPSTTDACSLTLGGHTNEKNFVGLSVSDGYIACGFAYYRSLPMPITSHKFGSIDPISGKETDDYSAQWVSSVCWRGNQAWLLLPIQTGV
ncbi:protein SPA1-RELATED 2 [Pyrus ussuriensis x Pyrus communis]|uniref:Protein SPA1-RELATED 2 n=1 Tax=Pyrus ussuriensis x Pyrus communis TaxID=2448454 RepID=A0A5N5HY68_9ROSA|nr:protein SPA1-RELATED 2 [Pyrus ussuriensis x Pyrus communis]